MKSTFVAAILALLGLNGCAAVAGGNGYAQGWAYSGYKTSGQLGTGADGKVGEACYSSILGIVAHGDGSLEAAKKAGGITQVAYVDHEQFSVIGVYATSCTIVHGQ